MSTQLPMPITAPLSNAQKTNVLNLVRRAARAEILPRFRKLDRGDILTKSSATDLVTEADTAAEAMITRGLQIAFPSALIIGEEAVAKNEKLLDKIAEAEMCFLIDPVDGTWNFANGMPAFGTMIAVCRFGQPVFGLIYDPIGDDAVMTDDMSPALHMPARGAGRKLSTAEDKPLDQMLGYMHLGLMPQEVKPIAAASLPKFASVTALRCSAYEYRLLAQGAVDFVFSSKLNPWDHAAGVLMCQQAGGHAALINGAPYSANLREGYLISASSKKVWEKVRDAFSDLAGD